MSDSAFWWFCQQDESPQFQVLSFELGTGSSFFSSLTTLGSVAEDSDMESGSFLSSDSNSLAACMNAQSKLSTAQLQGAPRLIHLQSHWQSDPTQHSGKSIWWKLINDPKERACQGRELNYQLILHFHMNIELNPKKEKTTNISANSHEHFLNFNLNLYAKVWQNALSPLTQIP